VKYIYIAGPYSQGNTMDNIQKACAIAEILADEGYIPFVPHLMGFMHLQGQRPESYWKNIGLQWVDRCDAVYRLRGDSPGTDEECKRALSQGKIVYHSMLSLLGYEPVTPNTCGSCRTGIHLHGVQQVICQCTCGCIEEKK